MFLRAFKNRFIFSFLHIVWYRSSSFSSSSMLSKTARSYSLISLGAILNEDIFWVEFGKKSWVVMSGLAVPERPSSICFACR